MTVMQALLWVQRLTALAVVLQTIEFLLIQKETTEGGIWSWNVIKDDFAHFPKPVPRLLGFFLNQPRFSYLLWIRLACALGFAFWFHPVFITLLLASTILISLRWRGTFNGGSDYMTLILLTGLAVPSIYKESSTSVIAGLGYITLQTCLSYFIAGAVKVKTPQWRSGSALRMFLSLSHYGVPAAVQRTVHLPLISIFVSWMVIIFELSFPMILLNSGFCLIYIAIALIFHLVNAYVFGLNRFLFAWAAAYPALYFFSQFGRIPSWR